MLLPCLFSLSLMALLHAGSVVAEPLHIALTPRAPSTKRGIDDYMDISESMRQKYGIKTGNRKRAVGGFGLMNQAGFGFCL